MHARGYPVLKDDHSVECWLGLGDDVTDRRVALAKLEKSECEFRTLAETTSNLVWIADDNAQIYYWNPAWFKFTGLTLEQSSGLGAAQVIREDLRATAVERWFDAIHSQIAFEMELPLRKQNGGYEWFTVKACPIRNAFGEVVRWCGVMTNIHDLKMTMKTLRSERQTRERFVSALVHDLKNAFGTGQAAMSAFVTLPTDDEQRGTLQNLVIRSFERASRMVEDLLDANRIQAGHPFFLDTVERLNLQACVSETASALSRASARVVDVRIDPKLEVQWSKKNIIRILENLITNAIKYGDTTLPITVRADLANESVRWSVHNWGNPIPVIDQACLFKFLERAGSAKHQCVEGWGIGLTLVNGLVEAHGGTIRIESDAERGTSFIIEMPRCAVAQA